MIPGDDPGDIDAYVAARFLPGLQPALVRKWAQLGQLERRGVDTKRRTLYRFADIEALWRDSCRRLLDKDRVIRSH
jgi:hypothetical protein